jgi:hypothetical protein
MFFIDLLFKFKGGMLVLDLLAHLFFLGLFIGSAVMLFNYVEDPEITMSNLLSISSTIIICSSFLALYFSYHSRFYDEITEISILYPKTQSNFVCSFALAIIILTAVAWFANIRRWKGAYPLIWVELAIILLIGMPLATNSFANSNDIRSEFSSDHDWINRIGNISEKYLIDAGCAAKYMPVYQCKSGVVIPWENQNDLKKGTTKCLNKKCLFTVGEIYTSDFYNASRFLSSAVFANVLLFISVSYLWKFGVTLPYKPEPVKAVGTLFLISLLVSFLMATIFYRTPYPETFPGEARKLEYAN